MACSTRASCFPLVSLQLPATFTASLGSTFRQNQFSPMSRQLSVSFQNSWKFQSLTSTSWKLAPLSPTSTFWIFFRTFSLYLLKMSSKSSPNCWSAPTPRCLRSSFRFCFFLCLTSLMIFLSSVVRWAAAGLVAAWSALCYAFCSRFFIIS